MRLIYFGLLVKNKMVRIKFFSRQICVICHATASPYILLNHFDGSLLKMTSLSYNKSHHLELDKSQSE